MINRYFIIGDLHGSFKPIRSFYQVMPFTLQNTNNIMICLGDFGANFWFDYRDKNFKEKLGKYPFTYFVIRGNHEERASVCAAKNPQEWHQEQFFNNTVLVENAYPYIKYALDCGGVYQIENKKCLVVPGAFSIDKQFRLDKNAPWFAQEQLTTDEMTTLKNIAAGQHFDYIFAHTCPQIFYPFMSDLFLTFIDQSAVDKTMERWLDTLIQEITYDYFYFGHYHDNRNIVPYKGIMLYDRVDELFNNKDDDIGAIFVDNL